MNKPLLTRLLLVVGVPTLYALLVRYFFGLGSVSELYTVMSVTFLFLMPMVIGALAVYLSSPDKGASLAYRILIPWVPVFVFFAATMLLSMEGWICWIMVMPLFLFTASVGGLLGGYLKKKVHDGKAYVSVLALSPFLVAPVENMIGAIPGTYEAYTCIDIRSTPERIWDNVTRVREIPQELDRGWLSRTMGFPRPVKAELDFLGVGASREAVFTNGLVFHETVTRYEDKKKMVFSIKADPHEIPATAMDEHIVVGGRFFDVLTGTYELERLDRETHRLHLYSRFKLTTTFNFYAGWWARWIMKDIQNNILQVEKLRAESRTER
jgi:hypothetical protein